MLAEEMGRSVPLRRGQCVTSLIAGSLDMSNSSIAERRNEAISCGVGVTTQIYAERAENSEIWDVEGRRYIDFASGIAVVNTGHRHPKVIAAVKAQLDRFTHTCHQVVPYENYVGLAERLNDLVPGNCVKKTIFVTTGAEAVENAVKVARAATGRSAVIAFGGAFHGRTFMGMALTGKVAPYKIGFGSMPGDVFHEGGFYEAPRDFLTALRKLCDQHGILLIADEVQTGFARTGKLFAMDHHDIAPDITTMAKSLAGGFPLAAVTGRAELMDAPEPGGLGGTYGGNSIGIAAAHAVLDVIDEEKLCDRANALGARLKQRLEALRDATPEIVDIRGPGFMNAVEFNDANKGLPSAEFANQVRLKALERGLILLTCGVYGNVIRFLSPITIQDGVMNEALDILEAAIKEARA
jgi:4-aminobutyrate aminotransferase